MDSLNTFLEMGGYARFVWPCFGLTFAVMVGLWLVSRQGLSRAEATLAELQAAAGGPRRRRTEGGDEA
jgi:heme exporter protein CcmD